jgi:hypothetical protein
MKAKSMKNLPRHNYLLELAISSPIRRIKMGEMSKLGWLIGLVKHTR